MADDKRGSANLKEGYQPQAGDLRKAYVPGKDIDAGYEPEASIADFVPPQGGSGLAPAPPRAAEPVAGGNSAAGAGGQDNSGD
jgi:hypothetical protein